MNPEIIMLLIGAIVVMVVIAMWVVQDFEMTNNSPKLTQEKPTTAKSTPEISVPPKINALNTDWWNWDHPIHNTHEQLERLNRARSADVTPAFIDKDSKSGEFVGAGENYYEVALDNCQCEDFKHRNLPCKHMYRLALELDLLDGTFESGTNRNITKSQIKREIFKFPVQSQELLYDICYEAIYHNESNFILDRSEFSELLLYKGYFVESVPTCDMFDNIALPKIKSVIRACEVDVPFKNNATKKAVLKWVGENETLIMPIVSTRYIFLEFMEHIGQEKHMICRQYATKFTSNEDVHYPGGAIAHQSKTKVFTQE